MAEQESPSAPRGLLAALVAQRVALPLLLFLALLLLPGVFQHDNYRDNFHWPPQASPSLATAFATWDSQHYLYLATEGYPADGPSVAYYPLWPLLIALARPLAGGHALAAALLLAGGCAVAAAWQLRAHVARRAGADAADAALLLLLTCPTGFFFSLPYSESLFLCLTLSVFRQLDRGNFGRAALVCALLPLCRAPGLFVAAPLAFALHAAWRDGRLAAPRALALVALPALGFGLYLAVMAAATGDAFAGFTVQHRFVARPTLARLADPLAVVRALFDLQLVPDPTRSLLDRLAFAACAASLPWLWRRQRLWFWYAVPMTLLPAVSTHFMSFARYAVVVFPAFAAAGSALAAPGRRPLLLLVAGVGLGLQVVLLLRHAHYYWVG